MLCITMTYQLPGKAHPETRVLDFDLIGPQHDMVCWRLANCGAAQAVNSQTTMSYLLAWWIAGEQAGLKEKPESLYSAFSIGALRAGNFEAEASSTEADEIDPLAPAPSPAPQD